MPQQVGASSPAAKVRPSNSSRSTPGSGPERRVGRSERRPAVVGLLGCGVMAGLGGAMNTGNVSRGDSVAVIGCSGVGDAAIAGPGWPARRRSSPSTLTRKAAVGNGIGRHPHDRRLEGRSGGGGAGTHRWVRRRRRRRRGGPSENVEIGLLRSRFGWHCRVGRRAHSGVDTRDAAHRLLLPRRRAEVVVVRRLPARARFSGARRAPLQQGRVPLEKFVSERIKLNQIEEAFATMHRGEVLRSVVVL